MNFRKEVNASNALTLLRLVSGPVVFFLILKGLNIPALILFFFALVTDVVDGYLARKFQMETVFGEHLDRWADKLLYGFVLFGILIHGHYYSWMWLFGFGVAAFLIGYPWAMKAQLKVTKQGRVFVFLESVLLVLFLLGFVNYYLLALFALFLLVPAVDYIIRVARKTAHRQ